MLTRIRQRLSFANVASTLALFVALSTGSAYAAGYLVSSNSQVAPDTISGHKPPAGKHSNVIPGSVAAADLAAPEAWHEVAPDTSNVPQCYNGQRPVGIFCTGPDGDPWGNAGAPFAPAAYFEDLQGSVHLRGLVSTVSTFSGTAPKSAIFYLPSGYRPAHELVFTSLDNDNQGSYLVRIDVLPDGAVLLYHDMMPTDASGYCACAQFVSLDGISFRTGA